MENATILIVDAEIKTRKVSKTILIENGYKILEANNGEKALEIFNINIENIKLIILDVDIQDVDGWSFLRKIRKISDVLVIVITSKSEEDDQLFGFELGADEYIIKPFSHKVLVSRVKALLRRNTVNSTKIEYEDLTIDFDSREVILKGEEIIFSFVEFEILKYLTENTEKVLTRDKILNRVWNYEYFGNPRNVDTHIKNIRQKLGNKRNYIETVRGVGYKFNSRRTNK